MKTLIPSCALAALCLSAMPGSYGDRNGPAPDIELEVRSTGLAFETRVSTDGGASWTSWAASTPNIAGLPGDVWESPAHVTAQGQTRVANGRVQWREHDAASWRDMREQNGTHIGNKPAAPPPSAAGDDTVGTLPATQTQAAP